MNRTGLAIRVLVAVAILTGIVAVHAIAAEQSRVEITIAVEAGRQENATLALVPEFERQNPGIKVNVVGLPYQSLSAKLSSTFAAKSSAYDAFSFSAQPVQYAAAGWLLPLDKYLANEPGYFDDFFPMHVERVKLPEGVQAPKGLEGTYYALPYDSAQMILFYREDLYEEKGLEVPETWEDFVNNAIALNDPANNVYGASVAGGTGPQQLNRVISIAVSLGGVPILDENLQPAVNSEAWVQAVQSYTDLIHVHKATPPGVMEYHYAEQNEAFSQGIVAQMVQYMVAMETVENPSSSVVSGKVGYAPFPGGRSLGGSWALGISPFSKHPDEAWEFIKFVNSRESVLLQTLQFANDFIRKSTFSEDEFKARYPNGPMLQSALEGVFSLPQIPEIGQIQQIVQEEVGKAVSLQKPVKQALDDAQKKLVEFLKESGY